MTSTVAGSYMEGDKRVIVPDRASSALLRTLEALQQAGFDNPRLFIDGQERYKTPGFFPAYPLTIREPRVRTAVNWVLAAIELYHRDPNADRYAIFQDDLVASKNIRAYLDTVPYQPKTYWNLFTFPANQRLAPHGHTGFFKSNGNGKGAIALVFDNATMMELVGSRYLIERVKDPHRGHCGIDGGISEALKLVGCHEQCHTPSLVDLTDAPSAMGHLPFPKSDTFRGETFDCLDLCRSLVTK